MTPPLSDADISARRRRFAIWHAQFLCTAALLLILGGIALNNASSITLIVGGAILIVIRVATGVLTVLSFKPAHESASSAKIARLTGLYLVSQARQSLLPIYFVLVLVAPHSWWWFAIVAAVGFTVVTIAVPRVPHDMRDSMPIERDALPQNCLRVLAAAGVDLSEVYLLAASRRARSLGLASNRPGVRRIALAPGLFDDPELLSVVVAHEAAHLRKLDWEFTSTVIASFVVPLASAAVLWATIWNMSDVTQSELAAFSVSVLWFVHTLVQIVLLAGSRRAEQLTDERAVELLGSVSTYCDGLSRLLGNAETPPWPTLFYVRNAIHFRMDDRISRLRASTERASSATVSSAG